MPVGARSTALAPVAGRYHPGLEEAVEGLGSNPPGIENVVGNALFGEN